MVSLATLTRASSLPFAASDEALVKVASETLTDPHFFDLFFALIDPYPLFSERPDARAVSTAPAPA